ncbi:MAG: FAD-binding protein [Phycisphaerae bacterium]|nr:FAD-binding protein [Phycisphaerae bacterium]
MSNYIVLTKQVPDITQITDNAFDPETGTLIRSRLASVINELDTQALAFANYMKKISADANGKIVALTMGPPMAEEVLRYSLGRCADMAVMLTDKALGGADTWATANPLAYAIRRIVKDFFAANEDYYVVCGMQSVDGDTAQVPPQIAEELSSPCIAYATGAEFENNRFEFTRIISGGSEVVAARKLPAVITVAKYEYPLFATFAGTRRANRMKIVCWNGDDIKATHIGAKGSKTTVIRVFPPGKSTRKCKHVSDAKTLAKLLVESFKSDGAESGDGNGKASCYVLPKRRRDKFDKSFERTKKENEDFEILSRTLKDLGVSEVGQIDDDVKDKILSAAGERFHKKVLDDMIEGLKLTEPSFTGEVWVVAEHSSGTIHPAIFELIGKARELADSLETKVGVCIAGDKVEPTAKELIAAGADNIYIIEDKLLKVFDPNAHRKVIADCISKHWPQIVLFGATAQGRMLAPMISYKLGCGLTADCTSFDIRDISRTGHVAILLQTRPALGGNVMATICTKDSKSQMATARPGVMKRLSPDKSRTGKTIRHQVKLSDGDTGLEIIKTELGSGAVNFNVEVIVSGGKGMQSRDNYDRLISSLCDCLSEKLGTPVERGASRAAVEQDFAERIHQVGQTGTAVGPKLYVALGISGAIQHMIGVANTETIIAVNSDPNAPIFKQCDYYVVGKIEDVVPQLIEALEAE